MESETGSSVDEQVGGGGGSAADRRGKHRILAEMKQVEQEIKLLEDELEELENTENMSTLFEELLQNVQTIPDPLLPETNGAVDPIWDQWFERPQDSQGCRCWIL